MGRRRVPREQLPEMFWQRVDKRGTDECWPYSLRTDATLHQSFFKEGAHRVAYALTFGEFPPHLHVLHHCDNPPCCNPAHLYLGGPIENSRDRVARGRAAKGSHNARAKLREPQVEEIKARIAAGEATGSIASSFGVSPMTIRRIRAGSHWKHVPNQPTRSPSA